MRKIVTNEYIEQEEYTILRITSPTHGSFDVLIDNEDVEKCKEHKWCIYINKFHRESKRDYCYAINKDGVLLHRFVMQVTDRKQFVDHIEGHTLDNRKEKLQICSNKENLRKSQFRLTNKSGHTGVIWYHYNNVNKWVAFIRVDDKFKNLGYYTDINDAIKAREKAEEYYFGEYKPITNCANEQNT
jgi:DUF4097 and DUF4098 domain-containing protein YvlB